MSWSSKGPSAEPTGAAHELVLRHSGHQEEAVVGVVRGDRDGFRAVIAPAAVEGPGGALPLAEGRWYLFLRTPGERDPEAYRPVRTITSLHSTLPRRQRLEGRDFTLQRRYHDRLVLESGSALAADRGPYGQRVRRERYAVLRTVAPAATRPAVLYSSFDGRRSPTRPGPSTANSPPGKRTSSTCGSSATSRRPVPTVRWSGSP
ncbi:hypothetical protein SBADM41S_10177 [Streptomyces badius]